MTKNRIEQQSSDEDKSKKILSDSMNEVLGKSLTSEEIDVAMEKVDEIADEANTDRDTVLRVMDAMRNQYTENMTIGDKIARDNDGLLDNDKLDIESGDGLLAIILHKHKGKGGGRAVKVIGAMKRDTAVFTVTALEKILKDFKRKLENKSNEFRI